MTPLTALELPPTPTSTRLMHQLFERQAARTPTAEALRFGSESLTYAQLEQRANRLAQTVRAVAPAAQFVAVSTTRGIESIVGLLAVLKAGKAYLPLDPAYPLERLQHCLHETGATCCVATAADRAVFEQLGLHVVSSAQEAPIAGQPEQDLPPDGHLAYVIYTSGSTGTPKGVAVEHAGVVSLIQWQARHSRLTVGGKALLFSPLTFDASIQEIFFAFHVGATLVLIDNDLRLDPKRLLRYISQQGITRVDLPFVALQYLTEAAVAAQHYPTCLQEVLTGGEQLKITPQIVQFFSALPTCDFYNQYGPTETSITATNLKLPGPPGQWPLLPGIGFPVDNTEIIVLDENLQRVAPGAEGELCIGGIGLAREYLNQPELTRTKFIWWQPGPGQAPRRLYRSGDLARYLPDGSLEYLGRQDGQVKIRGNRIELGEIEAALNQLTAVKQAVVVACETPTGARQLVAYLVAATTPLPSALVRQHLAQRLPDYMVPTAFVWLPAIPTTTSGKTDRNALPAPPTSRPEGRLYVAPATPRQARLAAIWQRVLALDDIGNTDNFFELGGNSLLALKLMGAIEDETGQRLPISALFTAPTIRELAQLLEARPAGQGWQALVPIKPQGSKPPLYLVHGMGLNVMIFNDISRRLDPEQPVYGLQAIGLDGVTEPLESIEEMATAFLEEMLAHNPTGPYALAGYSFGGLIAFEMAQQLRRLNRQVSLLGMLDSDISDQTPPAALGLMGTYLHRVGWVCRSLLKQPRQTARHYQSFVRWHLQGLLSRGMPQPTAGEASAAGNRRAIWEKLQAASRRYVVRPYDGVIDVFRAKDRIHSIQDREWYGWKPFARQGVRVHDCPGNHDNLLRAPNDQAFARIMQRVLDASS
ncbi:amino acid adenylation domain-containing protein [Hymenobacter sp. NST-14]|uniref:non-ribosomal peptide synthetase n=1 Tax=Hymenobacter piscis TaxID=2839984 RepID=UPI001C016E7C|nr:amino acid adenylation domain-containing protein [Hymenobacter piscis]MBT9393363.1 amino acid adenylation domain-containing protein [Hymenobacter piscis]